MKRSITLLLVFISMNCSKGEDEKTSTLDTIKSNISEGENTSTPDTTKPTISLVGDSTINILVGESFTDSGATASDDIDGNLSGSILITSSVDVSTAGSYTITYSITDAAGNQNSVERIVVVTNPDFKFEYNISQGIPSAWSDEFNLIMKNLKELIPTVSNNYFYGLPIYAWKQSEDKPFRDLIGDADGAFIGGNGAAVNGKYMVLEIPDDELEYSNYHRYSVIAHEYFHVYQLSLSKTFFDGNIELKWLSEGGAATFESLYIQQFYEFNYFKDSQSRVDVAAISNPSIFETYKASSDEDMNYSSSVFMFLALAKELQKLNFTEEEALRKALRDFWLTNPTDQNWKSKFQEVFTISVDQFYEALGDYQNNITTVLPDTNIKIQSIFTDKN